MAKRPLVCSLIDIASEMVKAGNHDAVAFMSRMSSEYGLNIETEGAAKIMSRAKENVVLDMSEDERRVAEKENALADYIASLRETSGREFLQSGLKAGLLSGLSAPQASLFGNVVSLASELVTRPLSVMADIVASKVTGLRSVSVAGLSNMTEVVSKRAAEDTVSVLLKGSKDADTALKYDSRRVDYKPFNEDGKLRYANHITRGLSWAINKVFDTVGAADVPARRAALVSGLHEQATLMAMNEGLKTKADIEKRVGELLGTNPNPEVILKYVAAEADKYPPVKEVLTAARAHENEVVFSTDSSATRLAASLSNPDLAGGWIGSLVLPFPKIPTNVTMRALESSPLGLLYGVGKLKKAVDLIKEGDLETGRREQRKASVAIGRGVTGSGLMMLGYIAFKAGMISEPTPTDEAEREVFYASGRQGSSVKLGNRWFALRDYPQLFALFAGAQIARSEQLSAANGAKFGAGDAVGAFALSTTSQVRDMPTMQGFESIVDSMDDFQRGLEAEQSLGSILWGTSLAKNIAGMVVPKVVKDVGQLAAADKYQRSAATPGDKVLADLPFTRTNAPAVHDMFGRPVETGPGRLLRGLSADQSERLSDPVAQEAYRVGLRSRSPSRGTTKKKMPGATEADHQARVRESGKSLSEALGAYVGSNGWDNMLPSEKKEWLKEISRDARADATEEFTAGVE